MGVRINFQTSGVVGVTEIFTGTLDSTNDGMTLASTSPMGTVTSDAAYAYVFTGSTAFSINLPAAGDAKIGSVFKFKYLLPAVPMGETQPVVTINRNGNPIDGGTDNIEVDIPNYAFELIYFGGALGWVAI